jgi:dTDP-4-dehydrorhamnose 3,5-epimerase
MTGKSIDLPDVKLLQAPYFADSRGAFCQTFSEASWRKDVGASGFVQDNWSLSRAPGTLRGLHFQNPPVAQAKLIQVMYGAIFDVIVDIRRSSPSYGRHMTVRLEAGSSQIFIPVGFAHGFMSIAPDTIVYYKVSAAYDPKSEGGIRWDDPDLGIAWPLKPSSGQISDRDMALPRIGDLRSAFD